MDNQTVKVHQAGNLLKRRSLEFTLIVMLVIFWFTAPNFGTGGNMINIVRNISVQGLIGWGLTMVMIGGAFDLSVGSMVGLSGCVIGFMLKNIPGDPTFVCIMGMVLALVIGVLGGAFNAFLITRFKMPAFIVTLGTNYVFLGIAGVATGGYPLTGFPDWYRNIASSNVLGIPNVVIIFLFLFLLFYIIMNHTVTGRAIYAVGGNPEAARLSGLNVKKYKYITLIVVQICSVLSGILMSSQVMAAKASFGAGWEMTGISAVIIGGVNINGGGGNVWGTFLGLLFLGIINNAMTLFNLGEYWQHLFRGLILVFAVLLNVLQLSDRKKSKSASAQSPDVAATAQQ